MKRILGLSLLFALLLLAAGCASAFESTPVPVAGPSPAQPLNVQQVQGSTTPQLPPPSKCQSKLMGHVLDANGAAAKGATIEVKMGSFSGKTISDDNGLYGFAGLCSGTYSFVVTLPGQPAKPVAASAQLDGANTGKVDLSVK